MRKMRSFPPIRRVPLASYASDPFASRGRLHPVPESATRTPFQRDRDRIIHSTAFRRLKHKTQVFVHHEGDHYRTRLTHTIEVAQVARSIARALYLDEDLAEAVALAHDLGHPPFGHSGEDALDAAMAPFGGFDHNAQSLRIVTTLETRYADHDGLNLTWEALEGIVKHNGPLTDSEGRPSGRSLAHGVPEEVLAFDAAWSLGLDTYAGLEAQAAAIADDIAYNAHDIDDGLRAGLFDLEDLRAVPFLADLLDGVDSRHPGLDPHRRAAETVRLIVMALIEDVILTALDRIEAGTIKSPADVRAAGQTLVAFSEPMAAAERDMKQFLFARMYRHERVEAVRGEAKGLLHDLFTRFLASPQDLPAEWRPTDSPDLGTLARRVCDYIAGMTDLYAVAEHRRLFDETPDLL